MVISKMRALVVAAVLAAAALAVGVAGASTPSVTITTPKAGQNISLKRTPYLAVTGQASFAPALPIARAHEEAVRPGLPAVWVAQAGQIPPCLQQCLLRRVPR